MARLLIGLSACYDALVAAPVVRALLAQDEQVHVAWFGARDGYLHALTLGLPDVPATLHGPLDGDPLLAAHEFAADDWFGCEVALTVGHDAFAIALAQAAAQRGRPTLRLQAGERTGSPLRDRDRRLADHAASLFCVRSQQERMRLCREGIADGAVAVVGSLVAEAIAALPAPAPAEPFLWLAIEHQDTVAALGAPLLDAVRDAAAAHRLPIRAVPTVLRGVEAADERWFHREHADPLGQLQAARSAAVVVTDSLGQQQLATDTGVPCIALHGGDRPRFDRGPDAPPDLAGGLGELPLALGRALARRAPTPRPTDSPAALVCAALRTLREPPVLTAALPSDAEASGRTFAEQERLLLDDVLRVGTLNSTRGTYVHRFEREFAAWLGTKHAIACASGSAAVHCAIAALGLAAGDEVITTPITDMGALTPILYEGAVPVFADVDPATLNVTAATIAAQLTDRTRAIVVTHLFGCPAELDAILALAERRGLAVVEDAAQAFGATCRDRKVGTFGRLAAFSLQQGKHITTGEGGIVCTDDDALARRVFLFVNKAWGYGDAEPDHYFPALNYRMTELQGAVACAQLPKLAGIVAARRAVAAALRDRLRDLAGLYCPDDPAHGTHGYWKFAFRVDPAVVPGGATALGGRMRALGIACVPRYVQKPAFECRVFRDWRRSPVSSLPLGHNPRGRTDGALFDRRDYPGAIAGLEQVVVLPINERYLPDHVRVVADAIRAAHRELAGG